MNSKKYAAEAIGTFWLTFAGCGSAVIMDGRVQHCTLQHFFGEGGVGTAVVKNE